MLGNKQLSRRERRILAVFPAALVLLLYSFLLAMPAQRKYNQQVAQFSDAKKSAVDELVAQSARDNLQLAQDNLAALRREFASNRLKIQKLGQSWRNRDSRLETVQEITGLLQRFDLSIVSQDYKPEPALSIYLKTLVTSINSYSTTAPLEFWQIELEGRYIDVHGFLSTINTQGLADMHTFPLTLSMQAAESSGGLHTWTIVFIL